MWVPIKRRNWNNLKNIQRVRLIIIETLDNIPQNIVLFNNQRWNKFVSVGGRVESCDFSECDALKRETLEETLNAIDISELIESDEKVQFNETSVGNERTRIYFLKIEICENEVSLECVFNENKIILDHCRENVPKDWKEMNSIKRFPFGNILRAINNDLVCIEDQGGVPWRVYNQVLEYVDKGLKEGVLDRIDPITEYENILNNKSFLNGTRTIKLKA